MSKFTRNSKVDEAKLIQVIAVVSIAGEGTKESPIHKVWEYFSTEGELLARTTQLSDLNLGNWDKEPES